MGQRLRAKNKKLARVRKAANKKGEMPKRTSTSVIQSKVTRKRRAYRD